MANRTSPPSSVRVVDDGFTVLSPGGKKPILDVVFVHGLGGHPQKTWSTEKKDPRASAEPSPNIIVRAGRAVGKLIHGKPKPGVEDNAGGRSGPLQPQDGTDETSGHSSRTPRTDTEVHEPAKNDNGPMEKVFWPLDLLSADFKDVRVLTFGYDSSPSSSTQTNLYTLSHNLNGRLANLREACPARPLIFVCHGGILVKFALERAKGSTGAMAHVQNIATSTWGIVFFATPHSGSRLADWGELLRRIAGVFKVTNSPLLAALNSRNDDGQLERLRDEFSNILGPRTEGKLTALSFRETAPPVGILPSLIPASELVVPLESAHIAGKWAENETVGGADHFSICKFGSRGDQAYQYFTGWLNRLLNEIKRQAAGEPTEQLTEEYRRDKQPCLESLGFQLSKKHRSPAKGTFSWVWSHPQFEHWYATETGVLWIQGKAGSGKSTLLRHLSEEHRKEHRKRRTNQVPKPMILFFSFFHQSKGLESSLKGLIRSLLFQIISQNEALGVPAIEAWRNALSVKDDGSHSSHWNDLYELKKLLVSTLNHGSSSNHAIIYIDALNECRGGPSKDDINFVLDDVVGDSQGNDFQTKLIISSQPTPRLNQSFASRHVPTINLNENNANDISTYLDSQLRSFMPLDTEIESIVCQIKKQAEGVFLWVRLMWEHYLIKLLEKKSVHGENVTKAELEAILSSPHEKLDETFRYVLGTVEPSRREAATALLKVVLHAARPLTLEELRYALAMGSPSHNFENKEEMLECRDFPLGDEDTEKQVTSKSGGLVEIKKHPDTSEKTVQVIHDSAREYLLRHLREGSIFPGCMAGEDGNTYLARACTNWLAVQDPRQLPSLPRRNESYSSYSRDVNLDLPLLRYAVTFWLHHLQEAENATKTSQAAFLLNYRALRSALQCGRICTEQRSWWIIWQQANSILRLMKRVDRRQTLPWTPEILTVAVNHGLLLTVRGFVETNGISSTTDGCVSLQCAAARSEYETMVLLLTHGAEVHSLRLYFSFWLARDKECTVHPQKSKILDMLLERGLELRHKGGLEALNTLSVAVATANTALIRKLVDKAIGHDTFELYLTGGFCAFAIFRKVLPSLPRAQVSEALTALTVLLVRPADKEVARRGLAKAINFFLDSLKEDKPRRHRSIAAWRRWDDEQNGITASMCRHLSGLGSVALEAGSDETVIQECLEREHLLFSEHGWGPDVPYGVLKAKDSASASFHAFQSCNTGMRQFS